MIVETKTIVIALCGQAGGYTWWEWEGQKFPTYEAALAAAQLDPEDAMNPDVQEALSVRYAQGLWIVALTSGAWAVFGPDRKLLATPRSLDEAWLRRFSQDTERRWLEAREAEFKARVPASLIAQANPEELGL